MRFRRIFVCLLSILAMATLIPAIDGSVVELVWPKTKDLNARVPITSSNQNGYDNYEDFKMDTWKYTDGKQSDNIETCKQKVIMALKPTCRTLKDESLVKLTLALVNCHISVLGKPIIECFDNMIPIDQCLKKIPSGLQNLYNQLLVRAREICLTIRQNQLRRLAELTVNRLIITAQQHLTIIDQIESNHIDVHKRDPISTDQLNEKQLKLIEKQEELARLIEKQKYLATENLHEIQNEWIQIKTVEERFHEAYDQSTDFSNMFQEIFRKLTKINDASHQLSSRIENIKKSILHQNQQTEIDTTIEKLSKIHQISEDLTVVFEMNLQKKFNWIERFIGVEGVLSDTGVIMGIHLVYLLIGMVILTFLGTDFLSRFIFFGGVMVNFIAIIQYNFDMDMFMLTQILLTLMAMNIIMKIIKNFTMIKRLCSTVYWSVRNAFKIEEKMKYRRDARLNLGFLKTELNNNRMTPPINPTFGRGCARTEPRTRLGFKDVDIVTPKFGQSNTK